MAGKNYDQIMLDQKWYETKTSVIWVLSNPEYMYSIKLKFFTKGSVIDDSQGSKYALDMFKIFLKRMNKSVF